MEEVHICEICQRAYGPNVYPGLNVLKTFKGYTVDLRLRQFRKVEFGKPIDFIDFDSLKGRALLDQMHEEVMR